MVFYNGIPRALMQKGDSGQDLKDRLNFARSQWLMKHGNHLLTLDKATAVEARKLFKFIDYNGAGVVSKH
jgi:hypothetical protein